MGAPQRKPARQAQRESAPAGKSSAKTPAPPAGKSPGFPIALKYALVTGILLIVFLVIEGFSAYQTAGSRMNRRINDTGADLAHLAASVIEPYWALPGVTEERKLAARTALRGSLQRFIELRPDVIDVLVYPADKKAVEALARVGQEIRLSSMEPLSDAIAQSQGVAIRMGKLEGTPVRSYEVSIARDGQTLGFVEVFLSAAAVEETYAELRNRAILVVLSAAVIGIFVAIVVGRWLTRPVRTLKEDMTIVSRGDLTHQSTIHTGDELEQLAQTFNKMTRNLAAAREQEASRKALERELAIATTIQESLLPDRIPSIPGYEMMSHYASAKEVGGDYYDFIDLGGYHHVIVIADVSGKGIPGSLVMTMTRSLVRMAARETHEPAELLGRVNATLSKDMTHGMFVTLTLLDLNHAKDTLRIARAGHNPAYLYRHATSELLMLQPEGIALGIDKGPLFASTLKVQSEELAPGDFVVLYTDGIIEAMDAAGKEYTVERFEKRLHESRDKGARQIVEHVLEDVQAHTGGIEASDDITLLVLRRRREGEEGELAG